MMDISGALFSNAVCVGFSVRSRRSYGTAQNRSCPRAKASRRDTALNSPDLFRRLEEVMVHNLNDKHTPGRRLDWENVAGCWVLRPPEDAPQALVVFVGDAFVGMSLNFHMCSSEVIEHLMMCAASQCRRCPRACI